MKAKNVTSLYRRLDGVVGYHVSRRNDELPDAVCVLRRDRVKCVRING
jgi:hypothetical protein